jgi:subtilisin family serine protease
MRSVPRRSSIALLAVAAALAAPTAASAAEGQIIVKYAAGADSAERADARADADVVRDEALPLPRTELVTPEGGTSVREAVADLERSPDVAYAEPDRVRSAAMADPTDPMFSQEWGLPAIAAQTAWDASTGQGVTVGVIDSGIDAGHADLQGQVDPGWNFVGPDMADTADANGHGTHVAGTIAAATNNGLGVAGVAFGARLMPLRVLDADGNGTVSDLITAYGYAESHHVPIVNASLGGTGFVQTEYDAIKAATDVLFVVAAGNGGSDGIGDSDDDPATAEYPCAYDLPNILCVAATRRDDTLASFSNYGATSVDLAAPGVGVQSTFPVALDVNDLNGTDGDGYRSMSGTSMATPHVAGAAALVLSKEPNLIPWQLAQALVSSVDKVPALDGMVASGGRLNAAAALGVTPPPASEQPAVAPATTQTPSAPQTTAPPQQPTAPVSPQPAPTPVPSSPAPASPSPVPSPAPVTHGGDRTAPSVAVALSGRRALAALLAGRLRASATVSERAIVWFELRVDARTAKRLRLGRGTAAVRIATGRAALTSAGTKRATLRLTAKAKRALARVRRLRATVRATATDAAGNARTRGRTFTLSR